MMSSTGPSPSTCMPFEEYLAYDNGTDKRYALVNGALVEVPPESNETLGLPDHGSWSGYSYTWSYGQTVTA
jgi:hypothetical protein